MNTKTDDSSWRLYWNIDDIKPYQDPTPVIEAAKRLLSMHDSGFAAIAMDSQVNSLHDALTAYDNQKTADMDNYKWITTRKPTKEDSWNEEVICLKEKRLVFTHWNSANTQDYNLPWQAIPECLQVKPDYIEENNEQQYPDCFGLLSKKLSSLTACVACYLEEECIKKITKELNNE